jgi:hypothetical protein
MDILDFLQQTAATTSPRARHNADDRAGVTLGCLYRPPARRPHT